MGSLKSAGGLGWLGVEHVQAGAQLAALERGPQRGLVHHFAAGGVDEDGVGLQQGEPGGIDELAGVGLQRQVQRHDVGLPEDVVHARAALDAELLGLLGRERARPGDGAQPERVRPGDDLAPDLARCRSTPSVLPKMPSALENSFLFHLWARKAATFSGMRRSMASSRANTSSATAIEFLPGQLLTKTPRALAVFTSMVLTPAPARSTSASWSAALSVSAVTCLPRTTRILQGAIEPGQLLGPGGWACR